MSEQRLYHIQVEGQLDPTWSGWLDGVTIQPAGEDRTLLAGPMRDQAALFGLLIKLRDMGLRLVSVNRVETLDRKKEKQTLMQNQDLWRLETQFWTAGADFYAQHLATDALMVFPAPAGVMDRAATLESLASAARWQRVEITDRHMIQPAPDTTVLVYVVRADRGGPDTAYAAQCSSTYVAARGEWRLVVHQQTPLG